MYNILNLFQHTHIIISISFRYHELLQILLDCTMLSYSYSFWFPFSVLCSCGGIFSSLQFRFVSKSPFSWRSLLRQNAPECWAGQFRNFHRHFLPNIAYVLHIWTNFNYAFPVILYLTYRYGDMRVVMNDLMVTYWKQLGEYIIRTYSILR